MNKIIINNNEIIDNNVKGISVLGNCISFNDSGEYNIEIDNSVDVNIEVVFKDDVVVKLYMYSFNNNISGNIKYLFGNNSSLSLYKFSCDYCVSLCEDIYLNGNSSNINYYYSGICNDVSDYNIRINHNNNSVSSYISNRFICNDGSKITFVIDSILKQGNIGCAMDQSSKIICMGDADARVCPNMYIDEDDVLAKHGSVIGKFSDEDIFYLMSRGIDYNSCIKLLVKGFILSNLNVCDNMIKVIGDVVDNIYK